MDRATRYSVVVPNLHSPRIGEVLDALERQAGLDGAYEVIVVGRDRYGLVQETERVRFLRSERDLNAGEARNRGIEAARGEVIFFLDADCIPDEDWMARLLRRYRQGYPIVGGGVTFSDRNFWTLCDNVSHFYGLYPDGRPRLAVDFNIHTANMCVSKALLVKVGKFSERFPGAAGEDFDLIMRIREGGYGLYFEPSALVTHRPERNSFRSVLRHSAIWARQSIGIRHRYAALLKTPWVLYHPLPLLFLSPMIAVWVSARIFLLYPRLLRYWYTFPVVLLSKIVWCLAAASELRTMSGQPAVKDVAPRGAPSRR